MKKKRCPLCKNIRFVPYLLVNDFNIVRCENCKFIFVLNVPNQKELDKFYEKKDYEDPISAEKIIRKDAIRSLEVIKKFTDSKEIFDVGCGRGYFLDEAVKGKWIVSGIDYSSRAINYAKKVLRLNVKQGDVLHTDIKIKYQVISLNQVIEHFSNPKKLVSSCKKILQNKGIIYIATPNIESLSSKLYKKDFDYMIPPEHLSYFSEETLRYLLQESGFNILYSATWSYVPEFAGIVKFYLKNGLKTKKNQLTEADSSYFVKSEELKSTLSRSDNKIKILKQNLFDELFCTKMHFLLDIFGRGSMVHIVGQKI